MKHVRPKLFFDSADRPTDYVDFENRIGYEEAIWCSKAMLVLGFI